MAYEFKMLMDNVPGSEGPVFDTHGRFFYVSPNLGSVRYLDDQGQQQELANTGGVPAGLQVTASNNIWVADMKLGLLHITPQGKVTHTVSEFNGKPMRGCNDCSLDSQGNLYATAPAGSGAGKPEGELYCLTTDGKVHLLDGGYEFCNGLAVSEDDKTLIVAETHTKKLWAFDIVEPGKVTNKRLFATLSGDHEGGPDGIDFDAEGNLLSTNWGGGTIEVFSPTGEPIEVIKLPFAKPSNLHFGGEDGQDLYITEHTNNAIWKTRFHRPGLIRFPQG